MEIKEGRRKKQRTMQVKIFFLLSKYQKNFFLMRSAAWKFLNKKEGKGMYRLIYRVVVVIKGEKENKKNIMGQTDIL